MLHLATPIEQESVIQHADKGVATAMWAAAHEQVYRCDSLYCRMVLTLNFQEKVEKAHCPWPKGYTHIVQMLLDWGVDVNECAWNGETHLLYAVHGDVFLRRSQKMELTQILKPTLGLLPWIQLQSWLQKCSTAYRATSAEATSKYQDVTQSSIYLLVLLNDSFVYIYSFIHWFFDTWSCSNLGQP